MLMVLQHGFLWSVHDDCLCHQRRCFRVELTRKAQKVGFEVIRPIGFVSFLLHLAFVSQLRRSKLPHEYDPLARLRNQGLHK